MNLLYYFCDSSQKNNTEISGLSSEYDLVKEGFSALFLESIVKIC